MKLSITEFLLPIIVLCGIIILLFIYKDYLRKNEKLDILLRRIGGAVFAGIYLSHYILRFRLYGFDTIILPFQLCSISMFLAIVLLFTKNRTIFSFVFYTGILGGMISLLTPVFGYDSSYYRYYQFYIAHSLLIVTPIYFMVVHHYYPSKFETVKAFLILQSIAVFMAIFNFFTNSDFMFLFIDKAKITKFPVISKFGGIPYYLILVELTGIALFYLMYRLTKFMKHYQINETETMEV